MVQAKLTQNEIEQVVHDHLSKIGRKGGQRTSTNRKHMSEIGRKGRATLVRNIIARAESAEPEKRK